MGEPENNFSYFFIFFRCFEGMGGPNNNIRNFKINLNDYLFISDVLIGRGGPDNAF